jgi:signal transduction histidine kinase
MIARLETSFAQIRQFSSDASHELRTPLTVMKGESELVLRRPRPVEDYIAVLESNLEEIDRMSRIVEELLFLSRADLGQVKTECEPVRLEALVEDIQRQACLLGQEREVDVIMGTIQPATVQGDELRLRELILNIVDNAVKYSYPQGKVEIDLRVEGRTAFASRCATTESVFPRRRTNRSSTVSSVPTMQEPTRKKEPDSVCPSAPGLPTRITATSRYTATWATAQPLRSYFPSRHRQLKNF